MRRTSIAIAILAVAALAGCGARDLHPDAGGGGTGGGGEGGEGGFVCLTCEPPLLSDFEDIAGATIVRYGTPPRNGFWYTYNDASATCVQTPAPASPPTPYVGQAPPIGVHDPTLGSLALHGSWSGCTTWGAGIGAELNVPISTDGTIYVGPKRPYDLSSYRGITFWAMAAPGSDVALRVQFPMSAETAVENGGTCNEVPTHKCGDDWGMPFTMPTNGNWKQITVLFSDPAFVQQGWARRTPGIRPT